MPCNKNPPGACTIPVATSIGELAAHGKTIEAPDPD
jgi:hypothetical protein